MSMEFSRQEYCSGLPFPSPGDLPHSGMEPGSPALQAESLPQASSHSTCCFVFGVSPIMKGFPDGSVGKECGRDLFDPWLGKIPWRREWQPTPVFLPGEFHGQRSLVGYSTWYHKSPT